MIQGLPRKLQMLRANYGLSQKQVADKLGVSPSVISGYETGERTPSAEILVGLSYLYNCSVDYLVGRQPTKPPVLLDTGGLTSDQIQALVHLIDSIKE